MLILVARCAGLSSRVNWVALALAAAGVLLAQAAQAQGITDARVLAITPNASATQTFTDNVDLNGATKTADSITRLSAGIGLRGQSGQVRGFLDYTLSELLYARRSNLNTTQNNLSANLSADLAEGRARVDSSANISQSAVSAFGAQPNNSGLPNANTTELRSLQISPSFRGPIGTGLRYTAVLGYGLTDAKNTTAGDSSTASASLHVEPSAAARVSWAVDASHLTSDYKAGRVTDDDRLFGTGKLRLDDYDLMLSAHGGTESTNMASVDRQRYNNWGVGAQWTPSPRTHLVAETERRFYGESHTLSLDYRTALTVWRLSNTRSLSTGSGASNGGARSSAFDYFFSNAALAAKFPDSSDRTKFVNAYLGQLGINPLSSFDPSFLQSAATVQDRKELSMVWRNARSSAMVTLTQTNTHRVDPVIRVADDLQNAGDIQLRGLSVDLSHSLTPVSSLGLVLSVQQSSAALTSQENRQKLISLQYNARLTAVSNLLLGGRRAVYETGLVSYAESALYATYGIRF